MSRELNIIRMWCPRGSLLGLLQFHFTYKHNVCCIIVSHWNPEDINNNVLQYNTDKTKIPCWWQV